VYAHPDGTYCMSPLDYTGNVLRDVTLMQTDLHSCGCTLPRTCAQRRCLRAWLCAAACVYAPSRACRRSHPEAQGGGSAEPADGPGRCTYPGATARARWAQAEECQWKLQQSTSGHRRSPRAGSRGCSTTCGVSDVGAECGCWDICGGGATAAVRGGRQLSAQLRHPRRRGTLQPRRRRAHSTRTCMLRSGECRRMCGMHAARRRWHARMQCTCTASGGT
jgi:hypothetical protein